jgi:hypothetical protein
MLPAIAFAPVLLELIMQGFFCHAPFEFFLDNLSIATGYTTCPFFYRTD